MLENFTLNTRVLSKLAVTSEHPINKVAVSVRKKFTNVTSPLTSSAQCLDAIEKLMNDAIAEISPTVPADQLCKIDGSVISNKDNIDTLLRTSFAREYFRRLRKATEAGELTPSDISPERFADLIDIAMRGTASERIEAQLNMFGPELNQERLQECFYSLYEPEVHTCTSLFLSNPLLHPHHKKTMPKFAKTYLLDKHDLNMKLRCVLGWSGKQLRDPALTVCADRCLMARSQLLRISKHRRHHDDERRAADESPARLLRRRVGRGSAVHAGLHRQSQHVLQRQGGEQTNAAPRRGIFRGHLPAGLACVLDISGTKPFCVC
jgi:hypothetical protein